MNLISVLAFAFLSSASRVQQPQGPPRPPNKLIVSGTVQTVQRTPVAGARVVADLIRLEPADTAGATCPPKPGWQRETASSPTGRSNSCSSHRDRNLMRVSSLKSLRPGAVASGTRPFLAIEFDSSSQCHGRMRFPPCVSTSFSVDSSRCALPNKRLKLAAPAPTWFACRPDIRCCRIPFVNVHIRRRSLSALR